MNTRPVTRTTLVHYGVIGVPMAFAGFPLYVLAPDFYATQYGLSLGLLGVMLLVIRLWDAVQDPFIGRLADLTAGRALPFVAAAMFWLCLSIALLFNTVVFSPVIWFGLCMFLAVTAYSIVAITLGTQATLWTDNITDQIRIASSREAFGLLGLVIAVSTPPLLQKIVSPDQVYLWYSAILVVLAGLGVLLFAHIARVKPSGIASVTKQSLYAAIRSLPSPSVKLLVIYSVSMLASSIPVVLVIFFVRDLLGAADLLGVFLLLYFMSGIAGMPLWKRLGERYGAYIAWATAHILAVIGFVGAFFLAEGAILAYALVCVLSGLALGADLTLPPALLSHHIHQHKKQNLSGTYYALLAFITKACLALASVIALPYLDYAGFIPQRANDPEALQALAVAYAVIPCAFKAFAAALLYWFFIAPSSGEKRESIQNHSHSRSTYHVE